MESALRRTGIDVIGIVPWGTHFCQFYETGQDLIDILVPYFKEGLDAGEFCMWVTSEPLRVEQATAALRAAVPDLDGYINRGQIEILDYSQWYTRSGRFSADEVLQGWVDKLTEAQERGFEGLRLTGNTFWLEKADWDDFTRYEETVNNVIGRYKMLAICTYCLQKCNALEILDVVANHQFALIKRSGRWEIIESGQHKKTEQALRESEEKLSALYTSMVEGVALHEVIYDRAGNPVDYIITDVNPSFEKITGLSRDRSLGKRASALYGADVPPYLGVYAKVASSGKPESFETYFGPMKKHFSISVFSPARGKFATVFSDITERRLMENALQEKQEEIEVQSEELEAQNEELRAGNVELAETIRKLQESEARYRSLAENIPSVLMRYDRDFRVVYLSPQAEDITGIPTEQFIGKTNRQVGMPEDLCNTWEAAIQRVFQTGANQELEFEFPEADGSGSKAFYLKLAPEYAPGGDIVQYVLGISTDITERKRAEEELRKSENQFKVLIDNLSSGVALVDEHGKFTIYNPAFLQMFGLFEDPSNIKNVNDQNWSDWQVFGEDGTLLHVDDHPVRKAAMTGKPVSSKLVGVRLPSGGELVWMQISAEPILKPDGKVDLLICTYHNVTERKQAEEALQETRNYLENLIDHANAPIIVWDTSFRITRFNQAFERLTGLKVAEVLGEHLDMLFPEESKEQSLEHIGRTLSGERWEALEIPILRADGSIRTVLWNSANIYGKDGKTVIATIAQGQDITERKQAEEALRESEQRFRLALRNAPVSVSAQDHNLRFTFGHTTSGRHGLRRSSASSTPTSSRRKRRSILLLIKRRVLDENVEVREQMWLDRPGGRMFLDVCFEPIHDGAGRVIGVGTATVDLTPMKIAEEALRESQALLSAVTGGHS